MNEIPVVLLAAGSSSRMGEPKQLLPWGNTSLIEHQILTLTGTGNPVNIILGYNSDLITPVIKKYKVNIFINENWEKGMGTSISYGISEIMQKYPKAVGVLICLLDQPMVTTSYINNMLNAFKPGSQKILASQSVSGWTGVPALFDKCYFNDLSKLGADEGAKKIILQHNEKVVILDAGEMLEDIDSPETYRNLLKKAGKSFKSHSQSIL